MDYGLSPVSSRALVRRIERFLDEFAGAGAGARSSGQLQCTAVAQGERAGKPLRHCVTVPVTLTWLHPADSEVLHEQGSVALRRARLWRLCSEAYGLRALILEDLERFPESAKGDILQRVGPEIPERTFRRALEELVAGGQVEATGETRARRFRLKAGISGHYDGDGQ